MRKTTPAAPAAAEPAAQDELTLTLRFTGAAKHFLLADCATYKTNPERWAKEALLDWLAEGIVNRHTDREELITRMGAEVHESGVARVNGNSPTPAEQEELASLEVNLHGDHGQQYGSFTLEPRLHQAVINFAAKENLSVEDAMPQLIERSMLSAITKELQKLAQTFDMEVAEFTRAFKDRTLPGQTLRREWDDKWEQSDCSEAQLMVACSNPEILARLQAVADFQYGGSVHELCAHSILSDLGMFYDDCLFHPQTGAIICERETVQKMLKVVNFSPLG